MRKREQWRHILDGEVRRWNAKAFHELIAELSEKQCYEVEFEGKKCQVEV
jgi:hypothetical protein